VHVDIDILHPLPMNWISAELQSALVVTPVLAANLIFSISLKDAYTYVYELQISVAFCKKTTLSFQATFENWFQFSFHD
jgi:hypothetical protein